MASDHAGDDSFAADLVDIVQNSKIFSTVDRAACEELLPRLEKITLKQGEALFHQGDPSDCLYILVEGQLLAYLKRHGGKKKIVGTIEKGETVGELGVLSNQPRSLTIRATVDCHLLKLPRSEFESFSRDHPNFIAKVIDLVISRSQQTIKLMGRKKVYQHIAIVRGDDHVKFDTFIQILENNFGEDAKFIFVDPSENDHLLSIIEKEEHEHISVIFILDADHFKNLRIKLNHIGGIYVVVDGDHKGALDNFALKMLSREQTPFTTQYELVLLHDDKIEQPKDTIHWLQQAEFTIHHHIKMHDNAAYQRLLRFMKGHATGVVFGGGGVKGWASLGGLHAILKEKIPIDMIGGTSAGSALAACYAYTLSLDKTKEAYQKITDGVERSLKWHQFTWPLISVISAHYTTNSIREIFNNTNIEDLWLNYFSVSVNLSKGQEEVQMVGPIWQAVRASGAIPGIAPPVLINGEMYYDGGLINNLPVDHMRAFLGDESFIIAICLTNRGEHVPKYNFPMIIPFRIGFLRKFRLGYRHYDFPPFFNTFMQALLVGSSAKEKLNQLKADILVYPDLSKFRSLSFDSKRLQKLTEIGYQAAQEELKKRTK